MSLASLIGRLRNVVRQESQMATQHLAFSRAAIVENYDPVRHAVRVMLQPEGILTGYIPVKEPWVGNGWGMYAPPSVGDVIEIHFLQGSKDSSCAGGRFYSAKTKPLPVPSGEFWLVHKTGTFLKFTNDGKVSVNSASDMNFVSGGDINMTSAGKINLDAGTEAILHGATKAIFDAGGTGFTYQPAQIDTYTDGVTGNHHSPNPPEEPI